MEKVKGHVQQLLQAIRNNISNVITQNSVVDTNQLITHNWTE
jgi:hypothetical protein